VHDAFPDLALTVESLLCAGDLVVARSTVSGTHRAPFLGVAATGRRAVWGAIAIYRVEAGRIVEQWLCEDWADALRQVGGVPVGTAGYDGDSATPRNGE
jgi:predicted ester cyclase